MGPQRDDVERLARSADLARRRAERLAVRATELERIRAALEGHSREVEQSLARRSRFFASVSHELRTPINAILGYNDLLRQGIYGALSEEQREVIEKVSSSAWQLLRLVDDTLDLARLEAGKLTLLRRSVDLAALAAEAVAAVEVAARQKGLTFRLERGDPVPEVHTDPGRVRQILLNLLSNAVKFTDEGEVALEVRHLPTPTIPPAPASPPGRDGWIAVTVRDTGSGIPSEQLGAIFQEFVQLPRPRGGALGTGLGLAIASRIARLLGGQLSAESELGVRSAFTLFLPCPAPPLEADGP
jgi:signal transduction histidine kinase